MDATRDAYDYGGDASSKAMPGDYYYDGTDADAGVEELESIDFDF